MNTFISSYFSRKTKEKSVKPWRTSILTLPDEDIILEMVDVMHNRAVLERDDNLEDDQL